LWLPGLALGAILIAALGGDAGIGNWLRLRGDLRSARQRIALLDRENAALRIQAEELEADAFAIERAIREDLEYARADETLVRLPRPLFLAPESQTSDSARSRIP
jgi:cell division protein FtsB